MRSFLVSTAPTEIIVKIFQQCDSLADVASLRLTCLRFESIWIAHSLVIISDAGPRLIPGFRRARMAARATALVHLAQSAGELPPEIDPDELERESRLPILTPTELDAVLDLHHFARCVEVRFCHYPCSRSHIKVRRAGGRWPPDRRPPPPWGTPEPPEGMAQWRERFHLSVFTSLFMGAVLARAYNEPFYPNGIATTEPLADRQRLGLLRELKEWRQSSAESFHLSLSSRDYLLRFPAYDLNGDHSTSEKVFGVLEQWLVTSSAAQAGALLTPVQFSQAPRPGPMPFPRQYFAHHPQGRDEWVIPWQQRLSTQFAQEPPHVTAHTLWVIAQSMHMFEFLLSCFENVDGEEGRGRLESPRGYGDFAFGMKRTAEVVLFGVFQPEKASTLRKIKDSADRPFRARPVGSGSPQRDPLLDSLDIPVVLEALCLRSGLQNHESWAFGPDLLAPPPPLQFFAFLLSKHFRLGLAISEYRDFDGTNEYVRFTACANVFANESADRTKRTEWATGGGRLLTDIPDGGRALYYQEMDDNPRYVPVYEQHSSLDSSSSEEWGS